MLELSETLVYIAKSGVFAVLFTLLLFYILRDSSKREAKLQSLINNLSANLNIVNNISNDVKEIKRYIGFNSAVSKAGYKLSKSKEGVC